ncbi:MAG: hypothetical protein A2096_11840 [Spirochaetes bacterium GWF1_41_5]|nr:MAG: hypothetical protein A2096_11840 [Spirochaetes bacterium GWF1_41_5]
MIFFLGYASIVSLQKMLDNTGHTFFSLTVQIYFNYIEKAGFIVLFTQEINLHPKTDVKTSFDKQNF